VNSDFELNCVTKGHDARKPSAESLSHSIVRVDELNTVKGLIVKDFEL
jgi:hypothetical protein